MSELLTERAVFAGQSTAPQRHTPGFEPKDKKDKKDPTLSAFRPAVREEH